MATPTVDSIADDSSTLPANAEADDAAPQIPEEVLALPIMRGLLSGEPAAVWTEIGTKGPEVATVLKHGKELVAAGFGFYRDKDAKLDLFFNRRFITPELIEAAAKKGRLKEVASSLSEVSASINGTAGAEASASLPAAGSPSPVPVDSALNTARVGNLSPGGPTSGNFPGAGRVLNSITQNAI